MTNAARFLRAALAASALVGAGTVLAACTSGDAGQASGTSLVEGVEAPVQAIDNTFRPEETTVAAGTEVVWSNRGRQDHNVLAADDGQSWGVQQDAFEPGDEYRYRFTEPGTYHYYCSLHGTKDSGMIGTIVVTDGEDQP